MLRSSLVATLVLALAVAPSQAAGEEAHHLAAPAVHAKAASAECGAGVVYDDGDFSDTYSLGDGDPGDSTMVMKFDLPGNTTAISQVCACFTRSDASDPENMTFEVVVYDDDGPDGKPGTLLGTAAATADGIPLFGASQFYSVALSGAPISLPDTSVYVGVRWPGGPILLCGDRSDGTPQRANYASGDQGSHWTGLETFFPATDLPRAMGLRVDTASATGCLSSPTVLCLNGNRFRVEATYTTGSGESGPAQVVQLTDDSGYLWFFNAANVEAVVKVLDACPLAEPRFWVFAGGLTDVRTVIRVTDTLRDVTRTYTNPLGTAFQPIQDTNAFDTCP